MEIKADMVQDSKGEMCPMPIAHLAKNMRNMKEGQILEVQADDEGAHADIPAWCEQTGNPLLGKEKVGDYYKFFIKKGA
jgi:tRNA 2-thiouridine synthesizing protein A